MTTKGEDVSSLVVESDGPVRVVTMSRPECRNAINAELHTELTHVWSTLAADPEAGCIVLTGSGTAFSAGGDTDWLLEVSRDADVRWRALDEARRLVLELLRCPLPVIAAVNGPAVGLGSSLASLCDVVLMSEDAYFADPHVALGVAAGDGAVVTWPFLVSLLRAKQWLFTGDRISAADAERFGLATRVVPAADLQWEALDLAHRLAGLPRYALRATKRALNQHLERAAQGTLDYVCAAESEHFTFPELAARLGVMDRS